MAGPERENYSPTLSAEPMEIRASLYRLLALLYKAEISLDLLQDLGHLPAADDLNSLDRSGELKARFNELAAELSSWQPKDISSLKQELDIDFARVFLGTGSKPAYPYESVYVDPYGMLMSEPYQEVIERYQSSGLRKVSRHGELEDHISFELAFMGHLCEKTGQALKAGNQEPVGRLLDEQNQFLRCHLIRWVPRFCQDVQQSCTTNFYNALAELTAAFIKSDAQFVADVESSKGLGETL